MKQEQITLRCEDGAEAVVFSKYTFKSLNAHSPNLIIKDINYEFTIEDSYVGGDYKGFFGRIKRAWRAFTDKPVVYTGIYCEDKNKMRKFLTNCLYLIDESDIEEITTLYQQIGGNDSVATNEEKDNKGVRYE